MKAMVQGAVPPIDPIMDVRWHQYAPALRWKWNRSSSKFYLRGHDDGDRLSVDAMRALQPG